MAVYQVQSIEELKNVIISHFDKYPLISKKRADFLLFKMAIELLIKKETPKNRRVRSRKIFKY